MNKLQKFLLIVFALLAFGQTAWAQEKEITWTEVGTKEALNSAIADGAHIRLTADITLSEYLKIGQSNNQTVTIDLDGHTLQRTGLTGPDANGHVIEVYSGSTLNIVDNSTEKGGTLTGGWANNGGGICNYGTVTLENVIITGCKAGQGGAIKNNINCSATLNNVTITDCEATDGGGIWNASNATLNINGGSITGCESTEHGGGGIVNYGTVNINGVNITGNTCKTNGCGIWSNGTLNMQGNVTVTGNTREDGVPQNVFLKSGKTITVTGPFTEGAQVAVFLEAGSGKFTSGYDTYNSSTAPSTYFTADLINQSVTLSDGEAMLSSLAGTVYYIEREWDSNAKKVKATQKTVTEFQVMNDNTTTLANNTWYVVNSNVAPKGHLKHNKDAVKVDGTAHLIICDGAELKAAIDLEGGSTLHIYAQSFGTGMINADGGIGPGHKGKMGDLFIHGGIIDAKSQSNDAGIGTCCISYYSIPDNSIDGGNVTIYDGTITAKGGSYGAGIGGGSTEGYDSFVQHIKIYGGNVVANGGFKAAGIGTGAGLQSEAHVNDYVIEIFGGNVEAHGGKYGAGIGSGQGISAGTLKVYGGIVKAYGGEDGAGIGCGERTTETTSTINGGKVFVNGGKVYAYGGKYGAGIGGGQDSNGATVIVNDGYVYADGGTDAAGIGSGEKYMPGTPNGGKLTVNGGHVFADGTGWGAGIGGGEDSDGAEVIINGGIVEAYAGSDAGNKSGCAIGSEDGDGHRGTLTIGDSLMVHAGSTPTSNSLFTAPERVPACYYRPYARIEPCNHEGATYTVNGNEADHTHTFHCSHCLHTFTHQHTFNENNVCTVCGVSASVSTASIYLPVYNDGTYSYSSTAQYTQQLVTGSTFQLPAPPASHIPTGVRFVGWRVGSPDELTLTDPRITPNEPDILPAGSSYTINDNVSFTPRYKTFHVFTTTGNWNETTNWCWNTVPDIDKEIVIAAEATIPANCTAQLGNNVSFDLGGSITIADGGQLVSSSVVNVTAEKNITGATDWTTASNGWYFIASPINSNLNPSNVENMLTTDTLLITETNTEGISYDLYKYDESATKPWVNYRAHTNEFVIANGAGYLYANANNQTLEFSGEIKPYSTSSNTVTLAQTGWNLIGNPFTCQVTVNQDFAELNNGSAVSNKTAGSVINPCAGIAVYGTAGQTVAFTKVEPSQPTAPNNGNLNIAIAQPATNRGTAATIDNAIVSFNEGSELPKFYFGTQNANIYIPQGGEEYAIVSVGNVGEMPVNFKAKENGTYTLTVNPEGVDMRYMHLIDNMTGADIDLLALQAQGPATYTFSAKTTDYESRFKLVFVANDVENGPSTGSGTFAFINNGNIIVNGGGTLQVIDMMGRILVSGDAKHCISTSGFAPGVYVIRLIDGEDVRTQKMVIE